VGRVAAKALTAKQVENESVPGYHADGPNTGLYLQVTPNDSGFTRSWVYRYTSPTTRKRRELGLGPAKVRKLNDARSLSAELRLRVLNGIDPKDERDRVRFEGIAARAHQISFDEAVKQCIAAKSAEWKNIKHGQQWRNTLTTYASPLLGRVPVESITIELVHKVLEPIWITKTETATRVRQRIETVLDWCKARGYCKGDNPASLKGGLGELLPKSQKIKRVEHHAALPYQRANEFVKALRAKSSLTSLALEFMLLTACRTGEVVGAKWEEIDLTSNIWTIPPERMKAGVQHRVPLSTRAIQIINLMKTQAHNEYLFPSYSVAKNTHMSSGSCLVAMKKMDSFKGYTPHGLRSTFRDWASETTNFANETLELALAHTIANKAEAAYRRQDQLDKRSKLMQQWQRHVESAVTDGAVINIAMARK
jgi:integrase